VQTQRDLKRARYDFLLSALRLKAATGTLGEEDLAAINALLDPSQPIEVPEVPAKNAPPADRLPPPAPGTPMPAPRSEREPPAVPAAASATASADDPAPAKRSTATRKKSTAKKVAVRTAR
jgi:hypothetical protein